MGTGVILYQKGKGFQALPAVKMKILSEMSGLPHHRSHSPILPSHLSYLQQPFPGSLRQKQSDEMLVCFSPGVWELDIFQVRPCPQVSRQHVTQHYSQGKTGIMDRELHSAHMCPRVPSLFQQLQEGCQARTPKFFLLGLLREVRGKE